MMKPWETEPEKSDFEAHGLKCAMRRNGGGAWCGYVGVNSNHPWFGKDYTDTVKVPQAIIDRPADIDKIGGINLLCASTMEDGYLDIVMAIDVHGGLTYASSEKDSELWWFGFDCSHYKDLKPNYDSIISTGGTYRDFEYVRSECENLAKQLAAYQFIRINDDT